MNCCKILVPIALLFLLGFCWCTAADAGADDRVDYYGKPKTTTCTTIKLKCRAGYHCEQRQVVCKRAPCNPVASCVKDEEPVPSGCALVRCAGGTHCVETQVQCFAPPCPPIVECVKNDEISNSSSK